MSTIGGKPTVCRVDERRTAGPRLSRADQNTNFRPSCSSRIGFLVVLIVPYSGLVNVVFGSFQIGLFNALNASNRNCRVLVRISRKFRMIDASTFKMPGPTKVLRPALPKVPNGCNAYALVLNHCAIDC